MNGMYFAGQHYWWLAVLLMGAAFFVLRTQYRLLQAFSGLFASSRTKQLFVGYATWRIKLKMACWVVALGGIACGLLQPQWGKKEQTMVQEGRDLVIMLDVSRSMLAKDLKPTRLDFAKHKIKQLLQALPCDRVALVLFAGDAFVQCPMTADHAAVLMFLDNVDQFTISAGTTALDLALGKACQIFARSPDRHHKLALVVTDGEDFSLSLSRATKQALENGVLVCALGIGSPQGAPIPVLDGQGNAVGHEVDAQGKVVLSILNEQLLQSLCTQLGGSYVRAGYDQSDIARLVGVVNRFEKERFHEQKVSSFYDRYPLFFAISWAALLLEWLL